MIPEAEQIAQQACGMFTEFLISQNYESKVVILICPLGDPLATIGASNVDLANTQKILQSYIQCSRPHEYPALPVTITNTALVPVIEQIPSQETVISNSVELSRFVAGKRFDPKWLVVQGCELIVELFGRNDYEIDCFIALEPFGLYSILPIGASTAEQTIVDIMIHNYLEQFDERLLEDEYQ